MSNRRRNLGWVTVDGIEYEMITNTKTGLRTYWHNYVLVYTFPHQTVQKLGHQTCDIMFVRMMLLKSRVENDLCFILTEQSPTGAVTTVGPIPWRESFKVAHAPVFT